MINAKLAELERTLAGIDRGHSPLALASSLSVEDGVLTDAIARLGLDVEIFVLDTGRLHLDTLAVVDALEERYNLVLRVYHPDAEAVDAFVARHGSNAFYDGVELREQCCAIRKLEPLSRALAGKAAWITGQRREQSGTRAALQAEEFDARHGIPKFNPLASWSEAEVWAYVERFDVPHNALYGQGYRSIGCAPCTRPVTPGEDARAGRWWWEIKSHRECGLHVAPDGRLVREKAAA